MAGRLTLQDVIKLHAPLLNPTKTFSSYRNQFYFERVDNRIVIRDYSYTKCPTVHRRYVFTPSMAHGILEHSRTLLSFDTVHITNPIRRMMTDEEEQEFFHRIASFATPEEYGEVDQAAETAWIKAAAQIIQKRRRQL